MSIEVRNSIMVILEKWFELTMPTPTNYSWFHILFLVQVIAATVLLIVFFRNASDKVFRRIILIGWITIMVLELYKQLVFSYQNNWEYPWYIFPFQLCSTPFYVLPIIAFVSREKHPKIAETCMGYMSFFSLFGGLCVMFYPNDVFVSTIGINIQTMIHHGMQVALGIYISVWMRKRFDIFYFLKSMIVFGICVSIALILNVTIGNAVSDTFNMFYLGPIHPCHLPLLSAIYPKVHFVLFVLIYVTGFSLAAFIIFGIKYLIFNKGFKKREVENA